MEKIKIVHLVNQLGLDGSSKVVLDLCNLFNTEEYEISVVSLTQNIELTRLTEWPKNVKVFSFSYYYDPDYSLRKYLALFFIKRITWRYSKEIISCLKKIKPDILHCHLQPRELIIAMLLAQDVKTRLCFTDHLTRLKEGSYSPVKMWLLTWIYKRIFSRFHIAAVSKSVWDYHCAFKLVNKSRIHKLIENKIDTSKFTPVYSNSSVIRVVYVARLHKVKGQDILIKAWAKLNTIKNVEMILVGGGDPEIEMELKELVRTLAPPNPILFSGSAVNVLPYLQSAHIGVFPSYQEGLPLSLLEMMSCGLPVVASNISEFQGIIKDGENGLFFEVGNSEDLKDKLQLLLNDSDLQKRIGREARRFVLDNYDISGLKASYESMYKEIMRH